MPTKRRRILTIEITEPEPEEPAIDDTRLDAALWHWDSTLSRFGWLKVDAEHRPAFRRFEADGPFATADVRKLGRALRDALDNRGHAIIWLSEDYADGPQRLLRLEIVSHQIEEESGPEE